MPNVSFSGLLIVSVVAFAAPLLLGLSPARRLPAVVLEIVAGIAMLRDLRDVSLALRPSYSGS